MKKYGIALLIFGLLCCGVVEKLSAQSARQQMILEDGEKVWAGVIRDGHLMPVSKGYTADMNGQNKYNQVQPLILTNKGQYAWSEQPFKSEITAQKVIITDSFNRVVTGRYGTTLAEVHQHVSDKYFKASGLLPDTLLFTAPQYNTWIELTYNQNQKDIVAYAKAIIDNGLPPGVLMIDDTWQEDYGLWDFHPGRFKDPKKMVEQLHEMGFKVMLWICPFISADQKLLYTDLKDKKALLMERIAREQKWENASRPLMVEWWNGVSAELDFSSPEGLKWFNAQLDNLVTKYNIDGFKFDAGDFQFYPENSLSRENITANAHSELYAQIGLRFPYNEYRACWKMGGQPLVQRLFDKEHSWKDLNQLIPHIVLQGLSGYTFCCPDMIGGGLYTTFQDTTKIDMELIVRSAQCQALMPMMQFSVAPWRILDTRHMEAVKEAVNLRKTFTPLIMKLARSAAQNGLPIVRNMEYVFPDQGLAAVKDQFMLGDEILVAPLLEKKSERLVILPKGRWKADDGTIYKGGQSIKIHVPLNRLPHFKKIK